MVYNSLFGHPIILNEQCIFVLNLFRRPCSLQDIQAQYTIENLEQWLHLFIKHHFLIPEWQDERIHLHRTIKKYIDRICRGQHLSSLGLILDERCNFNCSYCLARKVIEASNKKLSKVRRMTWSIAKNAIDRFMNFIKRRQRNKVEIYFGGSEPLLAWNLMQKVIDYSVGRYGNSYEFAFSTNSNASLITPTRAGYLAQNNVTVTTSLDGPLEVNDQIRRLVSGNGTFRRIISGWDNLDKEGKKVEWFCLTLTDQNIDRIKENFFDFLADRGITSCSFEPDMINSLQKDPDELVDMLLWFKKLGEKRNITVGGLWDKPFKNMFESRLKNKLFNCSAFTGMGISVSPSGIVLPCSYSRTELGTVEGLDDIFQSDSFRSLITSRVIGNIKACKGCEIEGQCMGGCYITSEYGKYTNSLEAFWYRCEVFKKVTHSLLLEVMTENGTIKQKDARKEVV